MFLADIGSMYQFVRSYSLEDRNQKHVYLLAVFRAEGESCLFVTC